MNKLDTWDGWRAKGYHVRKGQKNSGFNKAGEALFTENQIAITTKSKRRYNNYDGVDWDHQEGDYECFLLC